MLYSFWLISLGLGGLASVFGVAKYIDDPEQSSPGDIFILLGGGIFLLAVSLNSSFIEFIKSDGTTASYSGMYYLTLPFFGIAMIDFGFVFIVILKLINIRSTKMFGQT